MSDLPRSISNNKFARAQRERAEARQQRRSEARQRRERDLQRDWCVLELRAGETLHLFGWGDVAVEAGAVRVDGIALAAAGPCTRLRIAAPFCDAATAVCAAAPAGAVLRFSRAADGHVPGALLHSPFAPPRVPPSKHHRRGEEGDDDGDGDDGDAAGPAAPPADRRVRALMKRYGIDESPVRVLDRHVPELFVVTDAFLARHAALGAKKQQSEKVVVSKEDDVEDKEDETAEEATEETTEETTEGQNETTKEQEEEQEEEKEEEQEEESTTSSQESETDSMDETERREEKERNVLVVLPEALDAETEAVLAEVVAEARRGVARRVLVAGGRRLGKTTLARTVANRLLQDAGAPGTHAVAWLEGDPAQPELAPRGLLSLTVLDAPVHGPAATHAHRPAAAYYYSARAAGGVDAPVFLRAVHALLEHYAALRRDAARRGTVLHLVVNTQSWLAGTGYDTLVALCRMAAPHHALTLVAHEQRALHGAAARVLRAPDADALAAAGTRVHVLETPVPPVDARALAAPGSAAAREHAHLLYYFRDHVEPLLCAAAYRVPFGALTLVPVGTPSHTLAPADVFRALNGMLVALGSCDPACFVPPGAAAAPAAPRDMPRLVLPSPGTVSMLPPLVPCIGLAIVRSINVAQRFFELICPFNPVCSFSPHFTLVLRCFFTP